MAQNRQLDRLARIVKQLEQGVRQGIAGLQTGISALTASGTGTVPPKPKKELIRALEKLRTALNRAILALERRIGGGTKRKVARKPSARRSKKMPSA